MSATENETPLEGDPPETGGSPNAIRRAKTVFGNRIAFWVQSVECARA